MRRTTRAHDRSAASGEAGFSLVEFLMSTLILLAVSAAVFTMMAETQRTATYQTEVQGVLENSRIAMDTLERYIKQVGNNPSSAAFEPVTVTSSTQVRLRSDLTGSATGQSDKGDPDGDTSDVGEDVTISYDATSRQIRVTPQGGAAQPIADYISAFTLDYYDESGTATTVGANVRKIRITITGSSTLAHPQTGKTYGVQLQSDVQIANRQ